MKLYVLSDNIDTQHGMRLAGVDGVVVHTEQEITDALADIKKDADIAVILVTQKLAKDFPHLFSECKISSGVPLMVTIPDRHGGYTGNLTEYIKEAIGISI